MRSWAKWEKGLPVLLLGLCCCALIGERNRTGTERSTLPVSMLGWLHGSCLAIKNGNLHAGTPITLIEIKRPQVIIAAKIEGPLISEDDCIALFKDRKAVNRQAPRFFYRVSLSRNENGFLALGIVGKDTGIQIKEGVAEIPLDSRGARGIGGSCTTGEGVLFFIRSRNEKPKTIWTDYYYLGYDVEPDCPAVLLLDR